MTSTLHVTRHSLMITCTAIKNHPTATATAIATPHLLFPISISIYISPQLKNPEIPTLCIPMGDNQHHHEPQVSHHLQVAKATTAVSLGVSLTVLSGLTMSATIIGLVLLTPLLLIFSPVLIPAILTFFLIFAGFLTSGLLGITAAYVFYWMYRYVSGKHPIGADRLDRARERIAGAAMKMKKQFGAS
ncbi:hypothetical protein L6452_25852 [Arctium lappa]|uniref:Uncharacterized protein n=1 Tax=Arctium lappa TaxID=4217 RepID=A0ACB9ADF6_ARCLA|nr:hypothetical protein L6452_25852 [Arctium lappa]